MTHRERFIKTLKCEPIGGQVPTFELVFFLSMEAFGKVHPSQRHFEQWDQMSARERRLHIEDMADIYIRTAQRYDHSAIFIHPNPGGYDARRRDPLDPRRHPSDGLLRPDAGGAGGPP